jgi:sporulation protein YlmC with PRC-barrel domain
MHSTNSLIVARIQFYIHRKDTWRFFFSGSDVIEPKLLSLMKTLFLSGATIAILGLAVAPISGQTQSTTTSSTTYIETSKLVGKPVKSSQGEEIGVIKDVVLDRNTGCMAYTVLSTGGGGGRVAGGGGKMVAVPWSVYSPQSDLSTYTVTVERERIFNAPVFDYARIEEYSRPDYINNVYSYYGVSPGVGVGVGVSGGTSTTTTGAATTTTGAATGAGAQAGAAANQAGAASPAQSPMGAAASPSQGSPSPDASGQRAHPGAAAAAGAAAVRARETPTPSPYGRAGASPSKERSPSTKEKPEQPTPSGRGKTETQSETERAPSEEATTGEKTKKSTRERSRSREATTPPQRPEE